MIMDRLLLRVPFLAGLARRQRDLPLSEQILRWQLRAGASAHRRRLTDRIATQTSNRWADSVRTPHGDAEQLSNPGAHQLPREMFSASRDSHRTLISA